MHFYNVGKDWNVPFHLRMFLDSGLNFVMCLCFEHSVKTHLSVREQLLWCNLVVRRAGQNRDINALWWHIVSLWISDGHMQISSIGIVFCVNIRTYSGITWEPPAKRFWATSSRSVPNTQDMHGIVYWSGCCEIWCEFNWFWIGSYSGSFSTLGFY